MLRSLRGWAWGCQSSLSLRERPRLGFLQPGCQPEKEQLSVIDPAPGGVFARSLAPPHHLAGIHYSVVGMGRTEGLAFCRQVSSASQEKR